IIKIIK
nr:Chain A, Psm alpha-4 [Staphylococcus aureus]6FGR_B Chain B, Psm alpha-4 [Staphylococcus aureus]